MPVPSPILAPVVGLVAWTMLIWLWMYVTRIPAMSRMRMQLDPNAPRGEQMSQLPAAVRWKADNYNHLMEQPTLFYATVLTLALLEQGDALNLGLAWAYVGLRVAHSLIQALVNVILVRFSVFMIASAVLVVLALRAGMAVFQV